MGGYMDSWMNGWMGSRWMNEWLAGWIDYIYIYNRHIFMLKNWHIVMKTGKSRICRKFVSLDTQRRANTARQVWKPWGWLDSFLLRNHSLSFSKAFNWWDEAHPHREWQSFLFKVYQEVLVSFKNTLPETLRIVFEHISRHCGPVSLIHKIN